MSVPCDRIKGSAASASGSQIRLRYDDVLVGFENNSFCVAQERRFPFPRFPPEAEIFFHALSRDEAKGLDMKRFVFRSIEPQ